MRQKLATQSDRNEETKSWWGSLQGTDRKDHLFLILVPQFTINFLHNVVAQVPNVGKETHIMYLITNQSSLMNQMVPLTTICTFCRYIVCLFDYPFVDKDVSKLGKACPNHWYTDSNRLHYQYGSTTTITNHHWSSIGVVDPEVQYHSDQ